MIHFCISKVQSLTLIGGNSGIGKADKVIRQIFDALISPTLLSTFTWSGRAKGTQRKTPFKDYKNTQKLIYTVLNLVQNSYTLSSCICDIKCKILKYAYTKSGDVLQNDSLIVLNEDEIDH